MATYNSEKYILKQLDSIVAQSIPVDEVVICDDLSADNTVNVVNQFIAANGLKNWRVIRNDQNLGFSKNFSKAISHTSGDIVILCDHDDIWEIDKVKIIKDVFVSNNQILSLATSFVRIDENDVEKPIKKLLNHSNNNLIRFKVKKGSLTKISAEDVAVYNVTPGCCSAFRSSLKKNLFALDSPLPHDWNINFIAALKNGLYYLDKVTTRYRIYEKNTIGLVHQVILEKRLKDCKKNLEEKQELLKRAIHESVDKELIEYLTDLVVIFELRVKFLQNKFSIRMALSLFVKSIGKRGLWESIAADILTSIKN